MIVVCGILLIGAVMAATGGLLLNFRDRDLAESERRLNGIALVLAEQIDRNLQSIEVLQTAVIEHMQSLGIASAEDLERQMSGYDIHRRFKDRISGLPHINSLVLTDAQGRLINFSRSWPIPSVKVSDQDPSLAFQSDPRLTFYVGPPLRGPASGSWVVPVARKFTGPNGEFLGVVTGTMELAYFEKLFEAVATSPDESISLFHRDGTRLVRYPRQEPAVGQSFSMSRVFSDALSQSHHDTSRQTSKIDRKERLISDRGLGHFPIVVSVTTTVDGVLANWRSRLIAMIGMALTIAMAISAVVLVCVWLVGKKFREQSLQQDTALSNMSQGLTMFDRSKRLVVCNQRYIDIYGLSPGVVKPGCSFRDLMAHRKEIGSIQGDVDEHCSRILDNVALGGSIIIHTPSGRSVQITHRILADGGWVATHEDVTTQKRAERLIAETADELKLTNERFDAALSNMSQGICMFDGQKRLVVWNDHYAELYQLPPDLLKVGTPHDAIITDRVSRGILKGETNTPAVKTKIAELDQLPSDARSCRVDQFADGRLILVTRQPMADGGWVATHEDITERRRAEAEIDHLARHDVLTGLANRAEFNAKIEEASKRLQRNGRAVTVMMLDLDRFKNVNDALGHPAGDQLLVEVARRLKSSVRETDVLARLGGDEFAIIIQEVGPNQHEGAIALALRIISAVAQPFDLNGHPATVGTSIGIVFAPENGVDPEELLKKADLALYDVKANGRNDFRVFQAEMLEVAHTQETAESELRDAIERDEFELHYQPVVDVKKRLLHGVEALIRWRHPTKGLIGPDQFIPLAESTGLIVQIGEWVLQQACKDAASWPAHVKLAINISAVQFKNGNLFDVILCTLVETGLSPERLELEITETSLLENQEAHLATIRQLKNLGISMALDDFGTGYSSVSYLTNFPFDKIKIDKSFTQGALDRRACKAVVSSVLALAQGLGIATTAEGVETEDQYEYMRNAGVDLVQGYLFGRPVPLSEFGRQAATILTELVA